MHYFHKVVLILLPVVVLALGGCGGSSSGSTDPFTPGTGNPTIPSGTGTVVSYNMTLSVTPTSGTGTTVGANSIVIATATLTDSTGNPIDSQPVKFESVVGPVTIDPAIISTVSDGKAINFLRAGAPDAGSSAVDVILKASTSVKGQLVTAVAIFKILRSETNVIKFITSKGPTDPDGTLNTLKVSLDAVALPSPPRTILQLVPFEILDNNGVPRTRVPVTVSIYSRIGNCPVFIDSPETTDQTVTTDDTGRGIFNAGVTLDVPQMGSENSCSVIYKAEAPDINNSAATIFSYGGFMATLENLQPN
ncbi:hypothetical protein [Geomonas propionica]|uniref:Big-1 domain-containing protein n=1 Tax=Geomonas propionica TaxID=2798582 RepID=A0ABS0YMM1_9BACT|nr:hypothetical protein [Geomonas propionica]MBJ6799204.1 hypothetical protein [Geomonas propionica]